MTEATYDPATHYDRVTDAWAYLLGDELHYGVFAPGIDDLPGATRELTRLMTVAAAIRPGVSVLDVGCGTGAPACRLAGLGAAVVGITTSAVGVSLATERSRRAGLTALASFAVGDGMDNGFADASFDRLWVLESSHLMRDRARLIAECARVLRPGGRLALCDIMLRRPLAFLEVRRLLRPFTLLRDVFGDAHMETLDQYADRAETSGLVIVQSDDLTEATRPTFDRWRANAHDHRREVAAQLGEVGWQKFIDACDVLDGFWGDGTLGYGLLAAVKP